MVHNLRHCAGDNGARGCSFDNSERILNDNRGNTEAPADPLCTGWEDVLAGADETSESTSRWWSVSVSSRHTHTMRTTPNTHNTVDSQPGV